MKVTLEEARTLLQNGQVVAIPTETVYGLAAWMTNEDAVRRVFTLKGRPSHNPLILHVGKKEQCLQYISAHPVGLESLMDAYWPGPLTIVLPVKEWLIPQAVRANLATCA